MTGAVGVLVRATTRGAVGVVVIALAVYASAREKGWWIR